MNAEHFETKEQGSMSALNERYITDAEGKRIAVVLDLETFERLLDAQEELEDIRDAEATRAAIESGEEEVIPLEQAMAEYEAQHVAPSQQAS